MAGRALRASLSLAGNRSAQRRRGPRATPDADLARRSIGGRLQMGVCMDAALKLFEQLGIRPVQFNKQHRPGPRETTCVKLVDRMIHRHGARHSEQVLRTVADQGVLVADVIEALSDLALSHPRWARSADWSTTFAGIDLAGIRQTAKAANIRPRRVAIAVLSAIE